MMDFERAVQAFEEYLDEYDREDEKVRLKIIHTYAVVDCSREIAGRMGLSREERELAAMIALLHDIGRFEQLKRFGSFEPGTMDHAAYGAGILFGPKKMIRRFIKDPSWDAVIYEAILQHNRFQISGITDERTLLHAKLIRDADKLDNCRVKLDERIEVLLGCSATEAGAGRISEKVWESCLRRESVLSADRVTPVDYWVSYIAQYYDIYFPETFQIMEEQDYISRIIHRLQYPDPETAWKMDWLEKDMQDFMNHAVQAAGRAGGAGV